MDGQTHPHQRYPYTLSIHPSVSTSTSPSHSHDPYATSSTLDAFPSGSVSSYTASSPTSIPPDQRLANQITISKQIAARYGNFSAVPFEEVETVLNTLRDTHAQLTLVAIGQYSEERSHLINTLDALISRYQSKLPTIIPSPSPSASSPISHFQPSLNSPMSIQRSMDEDTKQSPPPRPLYTSTFVPDASLTPDWDAWSINRWGELVKRGKDDPKPKKLNAEVEQGREFKWVKMTRQWDKYSGRKRETLKRRIRKGIPDSVRAMVWPLITGSHAASQRQPGLYGKLIVQRSVHEEQIGRDINRTFPNHVFFKEDSASGSMGRESLTNVLKAYAVYDPELGYCQGFPLLHQYFYQLTCMMKRHLPKLHSHLKKHQIEPSLYATQWFITLFSYNLSFDTLMRVWDILFFEGPKILFRVALALLKMNEKRLLAADMENIFITFREIEEHPGSSDPDVLLTAAFKFGITRNEIESHAKEYQVIKLQEDQAKRKREEERKAKSNGTMNGKH